MRGVRHVITQVLNVTEAPLPGSSSFTMAEEEENRENCVPAPKLFGGLGDTITFAYGLLTRTSPMIHFTARKWRTYGST